MRLTNSNGGLPNSLVNSWFVGHPWRVGVLSPRGRISHILSPAVEGRLLNIGMDIQIRGRGQTSAPHWLFYGQV